MPDDAEEMELDFASRTSKPEPKDRGAGAIKPSYLFFVISTDDPDAGRAARNFSIPPVVF
jgi:hypothetical protein